MDKIILGIDPGTVIMGYGLIHLKGVQHQLITCDTIRLNKMEDHGMRLKEIYEQVTFVIEKYLPDELAIEAPFYGKNVQSMLKLGRAQGVAIAAAIGKNIPVFEYSPRKIKQSITGNGNASKEQVAAMLENLLQQKQGIHSELDATDALAVAMCHHFQTKPMGGGQATKSSYSGWKAFVSQHPDRMR